MYFGFFENLKGVRKMNKILIFAITFTLLMIAPCTAHVINVGVPNNMEPYSEEAIQFFDPIFKTMGYKPVYIKDDLAYLRVGVTTKNIDVILAAHPDSFFMNRVVFSDSYDNAQVYKSNIDYYEHYFCLASARGANFKNLNSVPKINGTTVPYDVYKKYINGTIQADSINDFLKQSIVNPVAKERIEVGAIIQVVGTNQSINSLISKLPSEMKISPTNWKEKKMISPSEVWYRKIEIKSNELVGEEPLVIAVSKDSPLSKNMFKINIAIIRNLREGRLKEIKENVQGLS